MFTCFDLSDSHTSQEDVFQNNGASDEMISLVASGDVLSPVVGQTGRQPSSHLNASQCGEVQLFFVVGGLYLEDIP